jgi:small-conductance mechanosensitive channel
MTELSDGVFRFLISLATAGFAGAWLIHDLVFVARARRQRRAGRRDPLLADQVFGYLVGITVAVIGLVGTLRFNGVF